MASRSKTPPQKPQRLSRRRRWIFRIVAAVGGPCLLLAMLELAARLAGYGYATDFLLAREQDGRQVLVQNDRFGWAYFGPRLARQPVPFVVDAEKPAGTVRVFVFGESAAFGDPQPDFGLPRMIEAILRLRHPDVDFDVINAAMTGINSHAIREIAESCAAADGDAWVIYMGNNEVVGPFGAGTVFGSQTPPLSVVRANIGLKEWRFGQLLGDLLGRAREASADEGEWGGMQMFLKHQVRRDDERMARVYRHFRSNLRTIVGLGRGSGAGVVVGTVAVNLRDCAPFASAPAPGLSGQERSAWQAHFEDGVRRYKAADYTAACESFASAARIDDADANLYFLWGQSRLAQGDVAGAREHLARARDLDLLRFRCDSRLQAITREITRDDTNVRLVDAAEELHALGDTPVSGSELFYEHVHLTFEGTYLLARLLVAELEQLPSLTGRTDISRTRAWPTLDQCADRLAWSDWAKRNVLADVLARLREAPFTAQMNHAEQVEAVVLQMESLSSGLDSDALAEAAEQCRRAVKAVPEDAVLQSQLAFLSGMTGDLESAVAAATRAAELLPHSADKWYQLGLLYAQQGRQEKAIEAFRRGLALRPDDVWTRHELARTLVRLDRSEEAISELRELIDANPRFGAAYLTLGSIYEDRGEPQEAEAMFRKAITHRLRRKGDLTALARVCRSKGWQEEAARSYRDALALDPLDPALHLETAQLLAVAGDRKAAERHFRQAIRLAPLSAELRYLFGVFYARQEKHAAAGEQFAAAVELDPELVDARLNFGMALLATNRRTEALAAFEETLTRHPDNEIARKYAEGLREELQE